MWENHEINSLPPRISHMCTQTDLNSSCHYGLCASIFLSWIFVMFLNIDADELQCISAFVSPRTARWLPYSAAPRSVVTSSILFGPLSILRVIFPSVTQVEAISKSFPTGSRVAGDQGYDLACLALTKALRHQHRPSRTPLWPESERSTRCGESVVLKEQRLRSSQINTFQTYSITRTSHGHSQKERAHVYKPVFHCWNGFLLKFGLLLSFCQSQNLSMCPCQKSMDWWYKCQGDPVIMVFPLILSHTGVDRITQGMMEFWLKFIHALVQSMSTHQMLSNKTKN